MGFPGMAGEGRFWGRSVYYNEFEKVVEKCRFGRHLPERGTATAPNRGKHCRCGNGTEGQCRAEDLLQGRSEKSHAATAPNRGKRCRCGNGTEGQCRAEGLWKGCRDESHAATALNRGKRCRCGNGTEGQCRAEDLQQGRRRK